MCLYQLELNKWVLTHNLLFDYVKSRYLLESGCVCVCAVKEISTAKILKSDFIVIACLVNKCPCNDLHFKTRK